MAIESGQATIANQPRRPRSRGIHASRLPSGDAHHDWYRAIGGGRANFISAAHHARVMAPSWQIIIARGAALSPIGAAKPLRRNFRRDGMQNLMPANFTTAKAVI